MQVVENLNGRGRTALITGGTSPIAIETAKALCSIGTRVVLASRNEAKCQAAVASILNEVPDADLRHMPLQLDSLECVRDFIQRYKASGLPLHILITGGSASTMAFCLTRDDYELHWAVTYLAHHYLVRELLPLMVQSATHDTDSQAALADKAPGVGELTRELSGPDADSPAPSCNEARIVHITCSTHFFSYRSARFTPGINYSTAQGRASALASHYWPLQSHGQAKLALVLHARALARRLASTSGPSCPVTINAVHPGITAHGLTKLCYEAGSWRQSVKEYGAALAGQVRTVKTEQQAAASVVYCAVHPQVAGVTGCYFSDCNLATPAMSARSDDAAEMLWAVSEDQIRSFLEHHDASHDGPAT